MKKQLKAKAILLGLAAMSLTAGICISATNSVSANGGSVDVFSAVNSFKMDEGASVKVATKPEDAGLSFSAKLDNAEYEALSKLGTVKVGFAIAPKNYADINALSKENLFGTGAKYYFEDNKIEGEHNDKNQFEIFHIDTPRVKVEGSTRTYIGSIVNFGSKTEDLLREYVCASYIEVIPDGTATPQYLMAKHFENDVKNSTRSMVYVAQHALATNDENVTDPVAFKNAYLTADVLSKDVTYTTNVYVNDMLIESKTDVAKLNDTVSYENSAYASFDGYSRQESIAYADGSTVLDVRLTAEENKVYEYLATSTSTAYDFSKPFQLIPITKGADTILDKNTNSIKSGLTEIDFGMTKRTADDYPSFDSNKLMNRDKLIKDYGLMGQELEYLALYENGTVTKYTIVPVTMKIGSVSDLQKAVPTTSSLSVGVFVLTADIDMKNVTWNSSNCVPEAQLKKFVDYTGWIKGFQGIFDGAGHTIENLKTSNTFFGTINPGSIIKNIGFTNVKETSKRGFLAFDCEAELNNVYVSFAENQEKELALTQDNYNQLILNNVVIDYTNHVNTPGSGTPLSYRGVLNGFGGNANTLSANNNFFVICDMPMIVETNGDSTIKRIVDAYNVKLTPEEYMEKLAKYGFSGTTFAGNKIGHATNESVLRFDKASDMKDYLKADQAPDGKKTLKLSGFNAKFWTFNAETGELTWNSANN